MASKASDAATRTLYLVDGSTYVFRAYHAVRNLSNAEGLPTNAVFGFTSMLLKLIQSEEPTHLGMVMDTKEPSFRSALYPAYKAHRPPVPEDLLLQFPYVHQVVEGFRIPLLLAPGFEADDVVATLTRAAVEAGFRVVVVSSDKDLAQLVGPQVTMLDTMVDKRYTPRAVEEKWGVAPGQIVDYLALCGDASDNIPGVKGIGAKGAATLLRDYDSLQGIYANLGAFKGKRRENLENCRDEAFLSQRLATLRFDAPVPLDLDALALREPDSEALYPLFRDLGFRRFANRYQPEAKPIERDFRTVLDEDGLAELKAAIDAAGELAFDLETTSLSTVDAEIVGLSFATDGVRAWYVPVAHRGLGAPAQLSLERVIEVLGPALADPAVKRYAQNHKYDVSILTRLGVEVGPVHFDPMLASYVLDSTTHRHNLDELAAQWLAHQTIKYEDVTGKGKNQVPFAHVPVEQATTYACEDAQITFRLVELLRPRVEEEGLLPLLDELELPLARVIGRMEMNGLAVDADQLRTMSRALAEQMVTREREAHEAAGLAFNPGSPKQLAEVLFDRLGLPVRRKTKTGRSTDSDVLASLESHHPLPGIVLAWRRVQKLRSTYAETLPRLVNERTGRIHSSFHQAATATGRLSSSDPNLQNIPVRTEEGRAIRAAFVAPEGRLFLSADYSQIELRVLAHLSRDPALVRAFAEGADIHTRTAAEIYDVLPMAVTREQRTHAKAINFGIVYGMGANRLAGDLGITRKEAKAIIARYFERYAGIKRYLDETLEGARATGEVRTLLGRRRPLPDIRSKSPRMRSIAERMAINTPVQGSAADLIKLAMLRAQASLDERGLATKLVLQVHDELVFEVPEAELAPVTTLVREAMEGAHALRVPLRIDIHTGRNWSEAHG